MATGDPLSDLHQPVAGVKLPESGEHDGIGQVLPRDADREFRDAFGEPLASVLDLKTWKPGEDLATLLNALREQVKGAVHSEVALLQVIRDQVFPAIQRRAERVPGAGVYRITADQLAQVHSHVLLNGGVQVCKGHVSIHEALPLTIIRIGVALVSYDGKQNCYSHQFFRRDLRWEEDVTVDRLVALLDRRQGAAATASGSGRDSLTNLSRRGLLAYAERAVLATESDAIWRMGHGSPMPVELLSGSGSIALLEAGNTVMRTLVMDHCRVVFIPNELRDHHLLTIGNALQPLEFAIIDTIEDRLNRIVDATHYNSDAATRLARACARDIGNAMVVGVLRASAAAPPCLFYAHKDYAQEAAAVVLADSVLQLHRGSPLLLELADRFGRENFGQDTMHGVAMEAYTDAGAPFRFLPPQAGE